MTDEKNDSLSLARTKAALEAYDRADAAYQKAVDDGKSKPTAEEARAYNELTDKLLAEVERAAEKVGEAFADDTADRNSRSTALLTRPSSWLRQMVEKYGGQKEKP